MSHAVHSEPEDNNDPDRAATRKIFPFLKLPAEVREMIYKPLIQSGNISILRVSKLVNMEVVPYLSKMGTFRIPLGDHDHERIVIPRVTGIFSFGTMTLAAPDCIQKLDIILDIRSRTIPTIDTQLIRMFGGKEILRKSCYITVKFGILGPIRHLLAKDEFYDALSTLTGFETLTLWLEDHKDDGEMGMLKTTTTTDLDRRSPFASCKEHYHRIFEVISRTLGPAQLPTRFDRDGLTFCPRKYKWMGLRTLSGKVHGWAECRLR